MHIDHLCSVRWLRLRIDTHFVCHGIPPRTGHIGTVYVQIGYIAQWLERLTADQQVPGSNPGVPSFFAVICHACGDIGTAPAKQHQTDTRKPTLVIPKLLRSSGWLGIFQPYVCWVIGLLVVAPESRIESELSHTQTPTIIERYRED